MEKKARAENILNMTNLQYNNNREAKLIYFRNTDDCSSFNRRTRPKIQYAQVSSVEKAVILPKNHMPREKN